MTNLKFEGSLPIAYRWQKVGKINGGRKYKEREKGESRFEIWVQVTEKRTRSAAVEVRCGCWLVGGGGGAEGVW